MRAINMEWSRLTFGGVSKLAESVALVLFQTEAFSKVTP
jgi:hypothetical protein